MILTADKGVSMVVLNRDDYNQKTETLLQESAYRPIPNDPTNKYKNKLIALLETIKTEGGINEATYKRLYPTEAGSPQVLWATQDTQRRYTIKAHSIQHWGSNLFNI